LNVAHHWRIWFTFLFSSRSLPTALTRSHPSYLHIYYMNKECVWVDFFSPKKIQNLKFIRSNRRFNDDDDDEGIFHSSTFIIISIRAMLRGWNRVHIKDFFFSLSKTLKAYQKSSKILSIFNHQNFDISFLSSFSSYININVLFTQHTIWRDIFLRLSTLLSLSLYDLMVKNIYRCQKLEKCLREVIKNIDFWASTTWQHFISTQTTSTFFSISPSSSTE
jgi:hypothetical protein